jgi:hypothetical protein
VWTIKAEIDFAGWIAYEDRRGFSLRHPPEWKVTRGSAGLLVSVAEAKGVSTSFVSNLNVVRRVNDKTAHLDELAREAAGEVHRLLTDAILIELDATTVAGNRARRLVFAYRQGIHGLTGEQWLFAEPARIWTITAGASNDVYPDIAKIFEAIVSSFAVDDRDD